MTERQGLYIIAARDPNDVIGNNGALPWDIPDELQYFRDTVRGRPLVMGRATYESIVKARGSPLPKSIVVTSKVLVGPYVCTEVDEALKLARQQDTLAFVIGGAQIYAAALDEVDGMLLSRVHNAYEGDTHFPQFNEDDWIQEVVKQHPEFTVTEFRRKEGTYAREVGSASASAR